MATALGSSERSALRTGAELPLALWLGLPLGYVAALVVARAAGADAWRWTVLDEFGFSETLTVLLFAAAAIYAFRIGLDRASGRASGNAWLRRLFLLYGALALLVAGEEASWGQHLFGWGTPDWLAEANKQQETNLHNVFERAADQKPRAIASLAIFAAAVVVPLLRRFGLLRLAAWPGLRALMPGLVFAPVGCLVLLPRVVDRAQVWFDVALPGGWHVPTRHYQEIQECFIGMFALMYAVALYRRLAAPAGS